MTAFVSGAEVLGRYRLERVLGSGGMGEVWSALHLLTRKRVALKVLKGEADDVLREDSVKRFFREARAISAVNHPNVVAVHDLFVHEGCPIMVMDLLEGEALASKLGRERTIELAELARILVPVISAVGAAHARGIVHRDLKPENIFLARSPAGSIEPKVLDFGIAKLSLGPVDAAQTDALTNTGTLLGTPFFMAPEQVFGEKTLDARCDVWAMGVILFLCLSGRRPFDGDNVGQIFKSILTRKPARLSELLSNVPEALSDLVERMLEKDVERRCPDLQEAFELLTRYADVRAVSFGPPALGAPPSTMSQPPHEGLPEGEAPTEMVPKSGQAAFSALSEGAFGVTAPLRQSRKKMVFAVIGAAVASIATAALVSQTRHEPLEPTSAAASFESRAVGVAKSEPSSREPSVSLAVDLPSAPPAAAIPAVPSAVPAPSSVAQVRAPRSRATIAAAKPAEPAATTSSAPAKLPGGILDQERAPF